MNKKRKERAIDESTGDSDGTEFGRNINYGSKDAIKYST
jgi:hypothetical protein